MPFYLAGLVRNHTLSEIPLSRGTLKFAMHPSTICQAWSSGHHMSCPNFFPQKWWNDHPGPCYCTSNRPEGWQEHISLPMFSCLAVRYRLTTYFQVLAWCHFDLQKIGPFPKKIPPDWNRRSCAPGRVGSAFLWGAWLCPWGIPFSPSSLFGSHFETCYQCVEKVIHISILGCLTSVEFKQVGAVKIGSYKLTLSYDITDLSFHFSLTIFAGQQWHLICWVDQERLAPGKPTLSFQHYPFSQNCRSTISLINCTILSFSLQSGRAGPCRKKFKSEEAGRMFSYWMRPLQIVMDAHQDNPFASEFKEQANVTHAGPIPLPELDSNINSRSTIGALALQCKIVLQGRLLDESWPALVLSSRL